MSTSIDAEALVRWLKVEAGRRISFAREKRTEAPRESFAYWREAELMGKAAEGLERNIPQEKEMEGGGTMWFPVCPECHGIIGSQDHYCRHCGQAVE